MSLRSILFNNSTGCCSSGLGSSAESGIVISGVTIMINSELKTDSSGREYFEIMRRFHFVSSNTFSPWYSHEKKNEVKRTFKLYKSGNAFYTVKNGTKFGTVERRANIDGVAKFSLARRNTTIYVYASGCDNYGAETDMVKARFR